MRSLKIAVYHNLVPGGALRALEELLRRSSATHTYDLFESTPAAEQRRSSGMDLALDPACRTQRSFDLPDHRFARAARGPVHSLTELWRLDALDTAIADVINTGGYDLAFVQPCVVRTTPTLLRKLRIPAVFFMQEPRRASFEFSARRHHRDTWRVGRTAVTRTLKPMVGALIEPVVARSDCVSLRRASAYVLCNSAFSAEEIKRAYGITAHVSYLGVDPGRFRPGASTAKTSKAELGRVVSVGTVARLKRHDMVIEALGRLPRGTRPALQVVGAGNDAQYVDTLIDLAKQNAVQLDIVRHATDVELVAAYQSAWATVCASDLEPFGLTALESISCGTPVIAVREGGFREIVTEGVTGYLVEPDIEGLTDGIARLRVTRSDFDPAALHESITADAWTWDDAVDRLHDHFRRALDSDKRQLHT